jgi:hypothetical protein
MIGSSLEYLKMVFQTILKMIIDLRIHHTTKNNEQTMGIHVLKRNVILVAKDLLVKNYFSNVCS